MNAKEIAAIHAIADAISQECTNWMPGNQMSEFQIKALIGAIGIIGEKE